MHGLRGPAVRLYHFGHPKSLIFANESRDIIEDYRIAGNFRKPKFSKNSFQCIFRKNIFEIFSFFATGLKNFKAPNFVKDFSEIS